MRINEQRTQQAGRGTVTQWLVTDLRPHEEQGSLFDDIPASLFFALVDDIREHGIQTPLEILPNGKIICGHQRRRAALELGFSHVPVIVRSDLEAQGEGAVVQRMIMDNAARRQLDSLASARAYQALMNLQAGSRPTWLQGDLRDWLAESFQTSGRNLDRLRQLLDLPRSIQSAISNGALPKSLARHLLALDIEKQQEAAARIAAGEPPRAVVKELAPHPPRRQRWPGTAFQELLRALRAALADLDGHLNKLAPTDDDRQVLLQGRELIDQLLLLQPDDE